MPCNERECALTPRPSNAPQVKAWCPSGNMFICHMGECGREQQREPLTRRSLLAKLYPGPDSSSEPVPFVTRLRKTFAEHAWTRHGRRLTAEQMDHFLVE